MATQIKCDNGHRRPGTCREAARELSEHRCLGPCPHCGEEVRYIVSHHYPFDKMTIEYEVIGVYAVLASAQAEREGHDPMVFLMENRENGERVVWPYYWTKNRYGRWANGQFPAILTIEDLKNAIKRFGL